MKALVKEKSEVGLKLQEVEKPKIKSDDVLIKVKATAICGTDLHIWNWDAWASKTIKPPMTVGHEFMGEVVEIGDDVKDLALGDRVSAESHIVAVLVEMLELENYILILILRIRVNRDGAFAEFVSVPLEM